MPNPPTAADSWGPAGLPLLAAAELQDHLMTATHDLDRLQHLLAEACDTLLQSFHGASEHMQALGAASHAEAVAQVQTRLGQAVMALQFQDMASQLIHHTSRRLRNCADRIAQEAMGDDDEDDEGGIAIVEDAPLRPNPVVQDDMSAGSIDLF